MKRYFLLYMFFLALGVAEEAPRIGIIDIPVEHLRAQLKLSFHSWGVWDLYGNSSIQGEDDFTRSHDKIEDGEKELRKAFESAPKEGDILVLIVTSDKEVKDNKDQGKIEIALSNLLKETGRKHYIYRWNPSDNTVQSVIQ